MKTLLDTDVNVNMARRSFLRYAGVGAAALTGVMAIESCSKHNDNNIVPVSTIDIGSGDVGILNYAYALEQLEAAFYLQVALTPYSGITSAETSLLTDIRDHEVAHREFFKTAIGANAIGGLSVDFSSIDFSSRASVLGAAQAFEDTGVSAYNGAGYLIQSVDYLALAGKIVSVEARHASLIRYLLNGGSFTDPNLLDVNASDKSASIANVLPIANKYLKVKVSAASFNYIP